MPTNKSTEEIETTLSKRTAVHDQWTADYRTQDNEAFFELAFDRIVSLLSVPRESARFLDAGCGSGRHSERLARRGYRVTAVDFSDAILDKASQYLEAAGLEDHVNFQREDLLNLTFADAEFDCILCWGVLMHILEVENAVSEFARVLKPGGLLTISEGNMYSLQALSFQLLRRLSGRGDAEVKRTKLGTEYWTQTESGSLLTREADIPRLCDMICSNGFEQVHRIPGQFTEAYTRFSSLPMRKAIHWLNRIWFKQIRVPKGAFGNILIFRRTA